MVLTYPNPSLSEITEAPSRDGSSIRTSETQTTAKPLAAPNNKKTTARQVILTIMYVKREHHHQTSLSRAGKKTIPLSIPPSIHLVLTS